MYHIFDNMYIYIYIHICKYNYTVRNSSLVIYLFSIQFIFNYIVSTNVTNIVVMGHVVI